MLDDTIPWRVLRVQVATKLGITPAQVDEMPNDDLDDCLSVWRAESDLTAERTS